MRSLLFKNLTSADKRRRIISSTEIVDKQGVRNIIQRHFICVIKKVEDNEMKQLKPFLYVLKERNTKEHKEKFFCRIKGSMFVINKGKLYLVLYNHSLKINLTSIPQLNPFA